MYISNGEISGNELPSRDGIDPSSDSYKHKCEVTIKENGLFFGVSIKLCQRSDSKIVYLLL